jgi:hypothetical protein
MANYYYGGRIAALGAAPAAYEDDDFIGPQKEVSVQLLL